MNLSTADELRVIYRKPGAAAAGKSRTSIDEASARFIGRSPLVMLSTASAPAIATSRHAVGRPVSSPCSTTPISRSPIWVATTVSTRSRTWSRTRRQACCSSSPASTTRCASTARHRHHRRRRARPPPSRPAPAEIGARRRNPGVVRPLRQGVPAESDVATRIVGGAHRHARSGRDRRLPVRDRRPRSVARRPRAGLRGGSRRPNGPKHELHDRDDASSTIQRSSASAWSDAA